MTVSMTHTHTHLDRLVVSDIIVQGVSVMFYALKLLCNHISDERLYIQMLHPTIHLNYCDCLPGVCSNPVFGSSFSRLYVQEIKYSGGSIWLVLVRLWSDYIKIEFSIFFLVSRLDYGRDVPLFLVE